MGLRVVARNRYLGSFIGDPVRGEVLDHSHILLLSSLGYPVGEVCGRARPLLAQQGG